MLKKIKTSLAYMEKEMPTFSYHGCLEKGHSCWTAPNTPVQKSDPFSWQKFRGKLFHTNWEIQVSVDLSSHFLYKGKISLLVFWFLQFKAFECWQFFSELPRVYTALIVLKMLFINLWGFCSQLRFQTYIEKKVKIKTYWYILIAFFVVQS